MEDRTEIPTWDKADPSSSIRRLYEWGVRKAKERISWYERKKNPKKRGSQWLRAFSIILVAVGAICPLIDATKIVADKSVIGQWGYVSLALAAALVGYDRYFGLSSGWMRYIVTQLSLERALSEFQFDWLILLYRHEGQPSTVDIPALIQRMKEFIAQVEILVKQETDAWVLEFQSNIAGLEKMLKAETETRRPGSIRVAISNARDFNKVVVHLNNSQVTELIGITEKLIDPVSPGRHELTAIAVKDNRESKVSKIAEVQPSTLTSVDLTMPPI